MYRMPGTGESSKSANVTEEKKLARQNVWHSVYFFVGYVLLLKLGTSTLCIKMFRSPHCI